MASRQLTVLQAGRGLAALSVLLFHCNGLVASAKYFGTQLVPPLISAYSGVQFFFVLSGFVIYLSHRQDIGKPQTFKKFAWKRFKRIYPPLWIALLLLIPILVLAGEQYSLGSILSAFLIAPLSAPEIYLGVEWTLRHEVLFYLFFSVLLLKRIPGYILLWTWIGLSAALSWFHLGYFSDFLLTANHVLFGMGILVCMFFLRFQAKASLAWAAVGAGTIIFALTWIAQWLHPLYPQPQLFFLGFGLGASAMIFGLINLERSGKLQVHGVLTFLGEASYAIYLVHYPILLATTKVFMRTELRNKPVIAFFLLILTGLAAGILFHIVLERPITRLLDKKRATPVPVGS